jgi:hypothetical protein
MRMIDYSISGVIILINLQIKATSNGPKNDSVSR